MMNDIPDTGDRNLRPATIRTVAPAMWTAFVLWLIGRFTNFGLTENEAIIIVPVLGGCLTVVYRVGREIERKWPAVGRIIFGSSKTPTYN